jgi:hypothetical protein
MSWNPDKAVVDRQRTRAREARDRPCGGWIGAGAALALSTCAKGRGVSKVVPVALLALSACLVPQSVDPAETRTHTVPIIDLSNLPTYLLTPVVPVYLQGSDDLKSSPQCKCVLNIQIPAIKEEDPTVDIEARWFVDYNLNGSAQSQLRALTQLLPGSFNAPGTFRGPVVFVFDPVSRGITVDPALEPNGSAHVIEMVIAEQQGFVPDFKTQLFPNRTLADTFDGSTFKIVASVRNSTASQCDRNAELSSPPLERRCGP